MSPSLLSELRRDIFDPPGGRRPSPSGATVYSALPGGAFIERAPLPSKGQPGTRQGAGAPAISGGDRPPSTARTQSGEEAAPRRMLNGSTDRATVNAMAGCRRPSPAAPSTHGPAAESAEGPPSQGRPLGPPPALHAPWRGCCSPPETGAGPPGGGNGPLNGPAAGNSSPHAVGSGPVIRADSPPPALHPIRPDLDIRLPRGYRLGEALANASIVIAVIWLLAEGALWLLS